VGIGQKPGYFWDILLGMNICEYWQFGRENQGTRVWRGRSVRVLQLQLELLVDNTGQEEIPICEFSG